MSIPSEELLSAMDIKRSSKSGFKISLTLTILSPGLISASQAGPPGIVRPTSEVSKGTPILKAMTKATNANTVLKATPAISTAARCQGFFDINSHSSPLVSSPFCSPASFT